MSLIRQVGLLLLAVLALAVGGAVVVNLLSARDTLADQVRLKNEDNAQTLAMLLSQQHGDAAAIGLVIRAQADTGHYASIRFEPAGGAPIEQRFEARPGAAPGWLRALLPIASEPGVAQVSDGRRAIGQVRVVTHVEHAYDALWRGGWRALLWMTLVGLVAALIARFGMQRLQAPLDATVAQAQALAEGRYLTVAEPAVPELRRVSAAMNTMVQRVRGLIESEAAQAERWRREAHCDALTGLPHRAHFLDRLAALAAREDGAAGGSLVLLRVAELDDANRRLGRQQVDDALRALAAALQAQVDRGGDALAGRLNGTDFALFSPDRGSAAEDTVDALAAALRAALATTGLDAHFGAVEVPPTWTASTLLAQADLALAQSEAGAPFAIVRLAEPAAGGGEQAWREQMEGALAAQRTAIAEFPLVGPAGGLVHLECPLRVGLVDGQPGVPAARWLPMALRTRLTAPLDAEALRLALAAIAADGRARCVNVSPASLADRDFVDNLRDRLMEVPALAAALWLELPEAAALEDRRAVQAFSRLLRPLGVRFGLEHAGSQLHRLERVVELGLDFVKLDAAVATGLVDNEPAQEFVRGTVRLLAGLGALTFAEGVARAEDAQALFACGVAGVTGPWARA
jgi:EAL domain-containing protein (putative c-di-GMP-specific phosphodiesterase class I)/GGDEF domain-containing protein